MSDDQCEDSELRAGKRWANGLLSLGPPRETGNNEVAQLEVEPGKEPGFRALPLCHTMPHCPLLAEVMALESRGGPHTPEPLTMARIQWGSRTRSKLVPDCPSSSLCDRVLKNVVWLGKNPSAQLLGLLFFWGKVREAREWFWEMWVESWQILEVN